MVRSANKICCCFLFFSLMQGLIFFQCGIYLGFGEVWMWGEDEETQFTSSVMCCALQSSNSFLAFFGNPKNARNSWGWNPKCPRNGPGCLRTVYWTGRGWWYRGVDWALWHVDFYPEIGLQMVVIKGHRVISTPDTSIVCPLWTPTEEKQGSLGTTAPLNHLSKELHAIYSH